MSDGRLGAMDANNNQGQLRTTKTKYDMVNVGSGPMAKPLWQQQQQLQSRLHGCYHAIEDDWVMSVDVSLASMMSSCE